MLTAAAEEQAENNKVMRRRELKTALFSFLLFFIVFSTIYISAEFDAPGILFLLVVLMGALILVKAK